VHVPKDEERSRKCSSSPASGEYPQNKKSTSLAALPLTYSAPLKLTRNVSTPAISAKPRSRTVSERAGNQNNIAPLIQLRQSQYSDHSSDSLIGDKSVTKSSKEDLGKIPGALVRKYSNQFESMAAEVRNKRDSLPHQRMPSGGNVEEKRKTFNTIGDAYSSSILPMSAPASTSPIMKPVPPGILRKLSQEAKQRLSQTTLTSTTSQSTSSEDVGKNEPRDNRISRLIEISPNGLSPINSMNSSAGPASQAGSAAGSASSIEPTSPISPESMERPLSVSFVNEPFSMTTDIMTGTERPRPLHPQTRPISSTSSNGSEIGTEQRTSRRKSSRARPLSLIFSPERHSIVQMLKSSILKTPTTKDVADRSDSSLDGLIVSTSSNVSSESQSSGLNMNGIMSPMFENLKNKRTSRLNVKDGSDPRVLSRQTSLMKKAADEQVVGGNLRTLDMIQDKYLKACEEGRVLALAVARKVSDPETTYDAIGIKFQFFYNTCKTIADISCCIVPVVEYKKQLNMLCQAHRSFRTDEVAQLDEYKSTVCDCFL
jgi:hypothetical protein